MSIRFRAAACSNKGCVRRNNEDNFCLDGQFMAREKMDEGALCVTETQEKALFAVCDGMGGEEAGEEASLLAVQICADYRQAEPMRTEPEKLKELFQHGCRKVLEQAEQRENHSGSTVALLIADHDGFHAANMGDSRIYRLTANRLEQISEDHTEVQRLLKRHQITEAEIKTHPKRHMILQYWGMPLAVAPFMPFISRTISYVHREKYLLCSDGLTDMVSRERIEELLRQSRTTAEIAQSLVDEALKNGGRDNVTVLVVEVEDEALVEDSTVDPAINSKAAREKSLEAEQLERYVKKRRRTGWALAVLAAAAALVLSRWIPRLLTLLPKA